jgi:hypothetical protein
MKTTLIMVIEHSKPIPDLTDIAAGRVYTLSGVKDVTATIQPQALVAPAMTAEQAEFFRRAWDAQNAGPYSMDASEVRS